MNPTLFNLSFTGKARKNIFCKNCNPENHTSDNCQENPARGSWQWRGEGSSLGGGAKEEDSLCIYQTGRLLI